MSGLQIKTPPSESSASPSAVFPGRPSGSMSCLPLPGSRTETADCSRLFGTSDGALVQTPCCGEWILWRQPPQENAICRSEDTKVANKPKSKMPLSERAKQFLPFAALKGLPEALAEKERQAQEENINIPWRPPLDRTAPETPLNPSGL